MQTLSLHNIRRVMVFTIITFLCLSLLITAVYAGDPVSQYESNTPIQDLLVKYAGSSLLGRPTDTSIAVNVISPAGMAAFLEYGMAPISYSNATATLKSANGEPLEFNLSGLNPATTYYYRINIKLSADQSYRSGVEHQFTTQKPMGSSYVFDVQADPHMDNHSDANVYTRTLQSIAGDHADFFIDLGDTFMTEKFAVNEEQVLRRYIETRAFFDIAGSSTPLFLVNGNHDGEFGWQFNTGNQNNTAYWAINARKAYYPNPFPNGYYLGSQTQDSIVGFHQNYYSWNWGNALFVVLDPYTYSGDFKKSGNMWDSTIGDDQYQWLKTTLEKSNATYKFVFEHHILGEYRGMTSVANLFEWGGYNPKGSYEFSTMRPNWTMPIHQLFARNNVTIFFQGHDHLFCREEKDGVIYQEVPQPSAEAGASNPDTNFAAAYVGQVISSSGYLRVQVSPQNVTVQYVKTGPQMTSEIPYSYSVNAAGELSSNPSSLSPNPSQTVTISTVTPQTSVSPSPSSGSQVLVTPTVSPNPSPTIPEFSLVFLFVVMIILISGAIAVSTKK